MPASFSKKALSVSEFCKEHQTGVPVLSEQEPRFRLPKKSVCGGLFRRAADVADSGGTGGVFHRDALHPVHPGPQPGGGMRALHFLSEDARAAKAGAALASGDFRAFLELVRQSGQSSSAYLQNVSPPGNARSQPMALTLALCSALLEGRGAVRVHGGGFGGWAQCYVPLDVLDRFICGCETALGKGSVRRLELCPHGAARI